MTLLTDSPAVYPYSSTVPPWPPACSWLVRAFSSSTHRSSWPAFGPWQLLSGQPHLHSILVVFSFQGKSGEGYWKIGSLLLKYFGACILNVECGYLSEYSLIYFFNDVAWENFIYDMRNDVIKEILIKRNKFEQYFL